MSYAHRRSAGSRPWLRILELTVLCSLLGVAAGRVSGFAQLVWGAKLLLLGGWVVVCLTLALFALMVAFAWMYPLCRRKSGDWL